LPASSLTKRFKNHGIQELRNGRGQEVEVEVEVQEMFTVTQNT
jgi:hypothetical protein